MDPTPAAGSLWSGSHDSLTPPSVDFQPLDFLRPCQEAAVDVCEIPRVHREQNGGGGGWTFVRRTSDWGGGLQIALPVYLTSFFEGKQICRLLWRIFTRQLINICSNMSVQICLVTLMFSLHGFFFYFFCQTRFVCFLSCQLQKFGCKVQVPCISVGTCTSNHRGVVSHQAVAAFPIPLE